MKNKITKKRILFYDIETPLLSFWGFRPGKQVVSSNALFGGGLKGYIICISYCWNDDKPVKCLKWIGTKTTHEEMLYKFHALATEADIVIGKNNIRFDNKHINTQLLLNRLPPLPTWKHYTDDLESQIKRHFYFPSNKLDHISKTLGLGGKHKMEFQDWVDIAIYKHLLSIPKEDRKSLASKCWVDNLFGVTIPQAIRDGKAALHKMYTYGIKDTADTKAIWDYCEEYITPKYRGYIPVDYSDIRCWTCGSSNLCKNGTRDTVSGKMQHFLCRDHKGFACRAAILKNGKYGAVRR